MENQEIGGAQALLLLGTQDKADDENISSPVVEEDPDLEEKANQQLNDAVEAAVMRYVGGTLDGEEVSGNTSVTELAKSGAGVPHKRRSQHDDIISNISEYQWDRFLEEEVAAGFDRSPKRKRTKSFNNGNDIDPELAVLDTATSEHDQLVHAAILGAGELANQLSLPGQGERRPEESAAINQLAHAASALSDGLKDRQPLRKRPLKKHDDLMEPLHRSKYDYSSLDSLLEQASSEACQWYNSQVNSGIGGPRLFSSVENSIVENFVDGYCRLNGLTREDICRRVWSNERTKDNFWELVTKVLPFRLRASVYKHVRRQYHVFDVRAKWTKEEDELLKKLTISSVPNWKKIGETMNRMPEDCRDRWRNYIKCGDNRASNKWSDEEERKLKDVVMEMITSEHTIKDKPISINWTLVSERMNGVRSRIQCRYKWNKLLRHESLSRVLLMDTETKLWLFNRLLESNFADADTVDWDYILHMYHEEHKGSKKGILWTTADFKVGFEKMKSGVRDHKNLPLHVVLSKLIASVYDSNGDILEKVKSPRTYEEPKRHTVEDEAASIANAAVAAVSSGVNEQEAQHQEYSLWR